MSEKRNRQTRQEARKHKMYAVNIYIMPFDDEGSYESIWETQKLAEKHLKDELDFTNHGSGVWVRYYFADDIISDVILADYCIAKIDEVDKNNSPKIDDDMSDMLAIVPDEKFIELDANERAAVGMSKLMSMYEREEIAIPALGDVISDTIETGVVYDDGNTTSILYQPLRSPYGRWDLDDDEEYFVHALLISKSGFAFDSNVSSGNGPFNKHRRDTKRQFPHPNEMLAGVVAGVMSERDELPEDFYEVGESLWYSDDDDNYYVAIELVYGEDDTEKYAVSLSTFDCQYEHKLIG